MGPFGTYLALMTAAWGMQLCPRLYLGSSQSVLRLQISSLTRAFIEANLYTLITMMILLLPFKMFTTRQQRNFKFIFVMPYLLQYISCFWSTTQNIKELLTSPAMLAVEDYVTVHLKMILILGLQLLAMIEMAFVLFYILKKEVAKYK
ncbi:uncharacterized protein LOC108042294 [Drosophila rhopaloa]|uniref:Uncharacterized protein n=2 Tax=Drosophila rhopaloa TaxID=1041015 RepID=A0ABM5H7W6_DRORH|nr:uncharacterized protein LOC108042294 [Drosophila rhopaloa]